MAGGLLLGVDRTAASGAFSPSDISGLKLWLKADSESYANNDFATTANDRSGTSNNGTASSGTPQFTTNIINGKPSYHFNAATWNYRLATNLTQTVWSAFVVMQDTSFLTSTSRAILVCDAASVYYDDSTNKWGVYAGGLVNSGTLTNGVPYILSVVARSYNDIDLVTNGSNVTKTNGTSWPSRGASNVGSDPSNAQYFGGDICEVLFYDSALSNTNRGLVEGYLNSKYAIY